MTSFTVPVVVNHGVLYRASGCESWCVLLSQWLWIMVWYAASVVVNYVVLCLWIMASYTEQVTMNHGLLYYASGCESWWVMLCQVCESWCVMLSQWLWIMVIYAEPNSCESCCVILSRLCLIYGVLCRAIGYKWYEPVVGKYGVLCWPSDSESWCVMLSKWLWVIVSYAEPVVVNHGVQCWASGCELLCVMLNQWLLFMVCYPEPVV
jgi:hypothetical protein